MAVQYVTLILDEADATGAQITAGSVSVAPSARLPDPSDQMIVGQAPVTAAFRAGTVPQLRLAATDSVAPLNGWTYTITYSGVPGSPASWSFYLPFSGGAVQRLSALAQVPAAQPGAQYLPLSTVTVLVPAPTGNTALDTPNVTAAVGSLVNALAFGPAALLFRDGTYVVDSNQLVIRSVSNFTVASAGRTVIQQAPNRAGLPNNTTGNIFTIADCTDFRVEGITFDANRDVVSPLTPMSAACTSGQPSCTVAAGQGSRYQVGQGLLIFGGYGTSEAGQNDGLSGVGVESPLYITAITPGGGAGGGDLITFGVNITHNYTQIGSTPVSDGFGPYAIQGAYLTPYQTAVNNSVAGRVLSGEDQQNGLHLISCQRATVSRVTSRSLWESGIKLGTGEAATSLTDGCADVTVADCVTYHGYDQGVSIWVSQRVAVHGCQVNASGWAGISMTASDYCTVSGNVSVNNVYAVPGDLQEGNGVAIEGGRGNVVSGNILNGSNYDGVRVILSPLWWGLPTNLAFPTTGAYLAELTAAGTSVLVSSTANLQAGGLYSILDGAQTEAVTVASIVDATHVTFSETLQFAHPAGCFIGRRIAQENVIEGNVIDGTNYGDGIKNAQAVRSVIRGNRITRWGLAGTGNGINLSLTSTSGPPSAFIGGDGSRVEGNILRGGTSGAIVAYGVSGQQLKGLSVTGNIVRSTGGGVPAVDLRAVSDSAVTGNHVSDISGGGQGIYLYIVGSTGCSRITVSDNTVRRCQFQGIEARQADSLTISGNQLDSNGSSGTIGQVDLRGVTRSVVANNTCNSGSHAGILLTDDGAAGSLYNRVVNNTCRDDGSGIRIDTGAAMTQAWGIRETGTVTNSNLYAFNEMDANSNAGQISLVGAASVQHFNVISGVIQAT